MEIYESVLQRWGVSEIELTELVVKNPSLKGILHGYIAEQKFHNLFLNHPEISMVKKDDDHDRRNKGDRKIIYKGEVVTIEVKSVQTSSAKQDEFGNWKGKTQVDGSDCREIELNDGETLKTTLLKRGEFDILAVNCFAFGNEWNFLFAKNENLPFATSKKYLDHHKKQLISSSIDIQLPPKDIFSLDFFSVLDEVVEQKKINKSIEASPT